MKIAIFKIFCLLLLSLYTFSVKAAPEDIVVIVNKDNSNSIDRRLIVNIYTGTTKGWPDGSPVFALDQPENSTQRKIFYQQIIRKSEVTMRAIWAQNIFSGRGLPPKTVALDNKMKELVSSNRNAIGYINASSVDNKIRVITP